MNIISNRKISFEHIFIVLIFNLFLLGLVYGPVLVNFFSFALFIVFLKKINLNKFTTLNDLDLTIKFQIIFCIYIILNSFFIFGETDLFYKSFFYFRFFLLAYVISHLLEFKNKTLNYVILSFLIFSVFLGIDIFYQYFTGYDFFGFEAGMCSYPNGSNLIDPSYCERFSGFFGKELIAGNFLATYGIMFLFLFASKFNNLKYNSYIFLSSFIIIIFAIILSGERNSILALLIILVFNLIFNQKYRKKLLLLISLFLVIFYFLFTNVNNVKHRYFEWPINYVKSMQSSGIKKLVNTTWGGHYITSYEIYLNNKIFGSGFKSFREECQKKEYNYQKINEKYDLNLRESGCSTHPHNLYFELLSELGLVGFTIFLIVLYLTIIQPFVRNFRIITKESDIIILLSIILTFIFPFKPTGSFSSSVFSTNMWFFIGFYLYFINQLKYQKKIKPKK